MSDLYSNIEHQTVRSSYYFKSPYLQVLTLTVFSYYMYKQN